MFKEKVSLVAAAASVLLAAGVASATDTPIYSMQPIVVADLGRDATALANLHPTAARILAVTPPQIPDIEKFYVDSREAAIRIHLDANGNVTTASILRTCGFANVDALALAAVRGATYQAATVAGKPVPGDYRVDVELSSDR